MKSNLLLAPSVICHQWAVSKVTNTQANKQTLHLKATESLCDSTVVKGWVWEILKIAKSAALCHSEGEVITIQNAKALYYRDTLQWCKAVLREIEELTYCFHLLFYLSALHSSVTTWGSHSLKSSDTVLLFSFYSHARVIPYHRTEWGSWLKNILATPKNSCVCFWMVDSLWLSERDLPLTCYNNMSRRMGDKGFFGKGLSAKMNLSRTQHWQRFSGSQHRGTYSQWQLFKHCFAWFSP